ncbi:MAG: hypothetical protein M3Q97_02070 [Bacteroidota bacterium]|nr:hypothetical protein [Bacteroidota bacterium]
MEGVINPYEETKEEERKKKLISFSITTAVYILILLLVLFLALTPPVPPDPGPSGGMEIALGTLDGGLEGTESTPEISEPTPSSPQETTPEEMETSNDADAPVVNQKPNVDPTPPQKPAPETKEPARTADPSKAYKGKPKGSGGSNSPTGSPTGSPNSTGTGGGGTGPGSGSGPGGDWELGGRGLLSKVTIPKQTDFQEGKITFEITVDRSGNVIDARYNTLGSTITNAAQIDFARKELMKQAKFSPNESAEDPYQIGKWVMTFTY